jgi:hypothetical protein
MCSQEAVLVAKTANSLMSLARTRHCAVWLFGYSANVQWSHGNEPVKPYIPSRPGQIHQFTDISLG